MAHLFLEKLAPRMAARLLDSAMHKVQHVKLRFVAKILIFAH